MIRNELLAAALKPETANAAARTIDVVWYTGASVMRYNFWADEEYMLAFSMDPAHVQLGRLNAGAPLLNAHQSDSLSNQIGVVRSGRIENGRGMATVEFSARPEVDPIWNDVQAGIIQNISMGAVINDIKDVTKKGEKMRSLLAIDWEPRELSAIPVPADAGAKFLSARESMQVPDDIQAFFERLRADRRLQDLAVTGAAGHAEEPNFRLELKSRIQRNLEHSL